MRKRFIAGAVCPRCGQMDRIVAHTPETGLPVRECVACGFNEQLKLDAVPEPETRVTAPIAPLAAAPAAGVVEQVIRFHPRQPRPKPTD